MTNPDGPPDGPPLTPGEVAALFRVKVETVTRWANTGKLTPFRTPGGTRRYHASEIKELLHGNR